MRHYYRWARSHKTGNLLLFTVVALLVLVGVAVAPRHRSVSAIRAKTAARVPDTGRPASEAVPIARAARLDPDYGKLALHFERNVGQAPAQVRYLARGQGYSLFLTDTEAVLALTRRTQQSSRAASNTRSGTERAAVVRMRLAGAEPPPRIAGLSPLPGRVNYLIGNDRSRWYTNVETVGRVRYEQVYPGIDLVYYGNGRRLEFDYLVAPRANPSRIRMVFTGVSRRDVRPDGSLVLQTPGGELVQRKPFIYQERGGRRDPVEGGYRLATDGSVGFEVGDYDRSRPLVIDPTLEYGTWLGGQGADAAIDLAVDPITGAVYLTGETDSLDFPAIGLGRRGATDAYITKLAPDGASLVYSTYIGGDGSEQGHSIAIDAAGQAYIAGYTYSSNFPTAGPYPSSTMGYGYVAALNASGTALVYSACLEVSAASAIAVTADGTAVVTGSIMAGPGLPVKAAFQPTADFNTHYVGFLMRFAPDGSLLNASYLGGNGTEDPLDIALDANGAAYIVGSTLSTDFPVTSAAAQPMATGSGLLQSADAGATWVPSASLVVPKITVLAPGTSAGDVFAGSTAGLYRTLDDGANWTRLTSATTSVQAIARDNVGNMYIGALHGGVLVGTAGGSIFQAPASAPWSTSADVWAVAAGADGVAYAGVYSDVYATSDAGANWVLAGSLTAQVQALAVDPHDSRTLYALTFGTGLYKSTDGGRNWVSKALPSTPYYGTLVVDGGSTPSTLVVGAVNGNATYRSTDGGEVWTTLAPPEGWSSLRALAMGTSGSVYAVFNGAVYISTSGDAWTKQGTEGLDGYGAMALLVSGNTLLAGRERPKDMFVARVGFGPSASRLDYATYLGGPGEDVARGVAVDGAGNIVVVGSGGAGFPVNGPSLGSSDGVLARIAADGTLSRSTLLPITAAAAVALDRDGRMYVAGGSPNSALNAVQGVAGSGGVMKVDSTVSTVRFATPVPGFFWNGAALGVDAAQNVYVAGQSVQDCYNYVTWSYAPCFAPASAAQPLFGGGDNDGYVLKLTTRPSITAVSPGRVSEAGGSVITITGTNFVDGMSVEIGGAPASGVVVTCPTAMTAIAPAHAAGPVAVTVTSPDAETASKPDAFTYVDGPKVTSISPNQGPLMGWTQIEILGSGFQPGVAVMIGNVAAGVPWSDATHITVNTPPGRTTGPADVFVFNPDGSSTTVAGGFTYTGPPPSVYSVSPAIGPPEGGTTVTISGWNFVSGATVTFGVTPAQSVTFVSATSLSAVAPAHALGAVGVRVQNPDGQFSPAPATFTYLMPPTITSVTPSEVPDFGGTPITIRGTNFAPSAYVTIGGLYAAVTYVDSTKLTAATRPSMATGPVSLVVTNPDGGSASTTLTVLPYPVLTSVSPTFGGRGASVTIRGRNFDLADAAVFIGGVEAEVASRAGTELHVTVPDGLGNGPADVTIAYTSLSRSRTYPSLFMVGSAPQVVGAPGPVVRASLDSNGSEYTTARSSYGVVYDETMASQDGRHILFTTGAPDQPAQFDLRVRDARAGTTALLARLDPSGGAYAMSGNGRFVAVANSSGTVKVYDRDANNDDVFDETQAGATPVATVVAVNGRLNDPGPTGSAVAISDDGRYVAFLSNSMGLVPGKTGNLVDVFVKDRDFNRNGVFDEPEPDATHVVRITRGLDGVEANGSSTQVAMSPDGRFVAFTSVATNLATGMAPVVPWYSQAFVHDRDVAGTGTFDRPGGTSTVRVSQAADGAPANASAWSPSISADGRYVAFGSAATNLVPGKTTNVADVFVADRGVPDAHGAFSSGASATFVRGSVTKQGVESNGFASLVTGAALTRDGRYVVFQTSASNLAVDLNGAYDVFRFDRLTGELVMVSTTPEGGRTDSAGLAAADSQYAAVVGDGSLVLFRSRAANLVNTDTNGISDVFLKTVTSNTPAGANVTTPAVDPMTGEQPVSLTFSSVIEGGSTTVATRASGPTGSTGFELLGAYYDITTTAHYSGPLTVCVAYPNVLPPDITADSLTLQHYENEEWVVLATTVNTATHEVCGQVTSLSPFAVFARTVRDTMPPVIEITSPVKGTYLVGEAVTAAYSCSDSNSAVTLCSGTTPNGAGIDTATPGWKSFTVLATDAAGNRSTVSVAYEVLYDVVPLYDDTKAKMSGSTYPIKVGLRDAAGANLSGPGIALTAVGISLTTDTVTGPVDDSGNANPDVNFRYDGEGYIFNLSTKGLATGTYLLHFKCGSDPTVHTARFNVR